VVLGGEEAVSAGVEDALAGLTDGSVERLSGPDRYATSAAIAREAFGGTAPTVYMTTGLDFPDALAGGVVAGTEGAPLLTVDPRCVPDPVLAELDRLAPDMLVVLGGTGAVSEDAADLVPCSALAGPRASVVQTGLTTPWDVAFTPDGRTFLTERDPGLVRERLPDGRLAVVREFDVDSAGEGGLLGLATSPDYAEDGWLYALYTRSNDQVIVRFRPDGRGAQTIVAGLPDNTFHDAGRIAFGPDGMLWVGMGDAGDAAAAQDTTSLAGKILRYTPDGVPAPGNPFGNAVYAYGLRDPQGLAWDADGDLYATEFGPDRDDEINRIVPGGNYGWPEVTGSDGGNPVYVDPIVVRQPPDASWSGAGLLVDGAIPAWEGDLFAAALRGERLYRVDLDASGGVAGVEELLVGQFGRLRHVTQAPDGALWVLTSNCGQRGSGCPTDGDMIVRLGR
jgi:glucose/arabinose dehydrogenase